MDNQVNSDSVNVQQLLIIMCVTTLILVAFMTLWSGIANQCWSFRVSSQKGEQKRLPNRMERVPSTIKLVVMPGSSIQYAQRIDLSNVKDWSQRSDLRPAQDSNRTAVAPLYYTESMRFSTGSLPAVEPLDDLSNRGQKHQRKSSVVDSLGDHSNRGQKVVEKEQKHQRQGSVVDSLGDHSNRGQKVVEKDSLVESLEGNFGSLQKDSVPLVGGELELSAIV